MSDIQKAIELINNAYIGIDDSLIVPNAAYVDNFDIKKKILSALQEQAKRETENKPLTLEQLAERMGKPFWYQPIASGEDTPFDNDPKWFICNPDKLPEPFYLYGKTWLAYAREPVSK